MLFYLEDYYCYIPLSGRDVKPHALNDRWAIEGINPAKCTVIGTAQISISCQDHPVYCQELQPYRNSPPELINFILLPKDNAQYFDIEIDRMAYGEYFWGKSQIIPSFAPPLDLRHILKVSDIYKYIMAGGDIINKTIKGKFKFANIKTSDTKFVSL